MNRYDVVVIYGRSQINFAVSEAPAQSAPLPNGLYDVWCDVDCFIKVAPDDATDGLTTDTGYIILANNVVTIDVRAGDRIGAVSASAGTFRFHATGA